MLLLSSEIVQFVFKTVSEGMTFCLFESGMENMRCSVTEVIVDDEAKFLLDLHGGGFFYFFLRMTLWLLSSVFSCPLYWDQYWS